MPLFNALKGYMKPAANEGAAQPRQASEKSSLNSGGIGGIEPSTPSVSLPSRAHSRPPSLSLYPAGDFRNQNAEEIADIKCDVMINWLHQQQLESMWSAGAPGEGIVLKRRKNDFISCPSDLKQERDGLFAAVSGMNVRVCHLFSSP